MPIGPLANRQVLVSLNSSCCGQISALTIPARQDLTPAMTPKRSRQITSFRSTSSFSQNKSFSEDSGSSQSKASSHHMIASNIAESTQTESSNRNNACSQIKSDEVPHPRWKEWLNDAASSNDPSMLTKFFANTPLPNHGPNVLKRVATTANNDRPAKRQFTLVFDSSPDVVSDSAPLLGDIDNAANEAAPMTFEDQGQRLKRCRSFYNTTASSGHHGFRCRLCPRIFASQPDLDYHESMCIFRIQNSQVSAVAAEASRRKASATSAFYTCPLCEYAALDWDGTERHVKSCIQRALCAQVPRFRPCASAPDPRDIVVSKRDLSA